MSTRYGWEPSQIFPYESLWSILQKFMFWNVCTPAELWQTFNRTHYRYPTGTNNPLTSKVVDFHKLKRGLNLSDQSLAAAQLTYYLDPDEIPVLGCRTLRYCPECLAEGYHSAIHQLLFIEQCPHHHANLLNNCPSCSKPINISLKSDKYYSTYSCPDCGYGFVEGEDSFDFPVRQARNQVFAEVADWLVKLRGYPRNDRQTTKLWVGERVSVARKRARIRVLPHIWGDMLGIEAPFSTHNTGTQYVKLVCNNSSLGGENDVRVVYWRALSQLKNDLRNHEQCIAVVQKTWWPDIYYARSMWDQVCTYGQAYVLLRIYCEARERPQSLKSYGAQLSDLFVLPEGLDDHLMFNSKILNVYLLTLFWECVALARLWRKQRMFRFDVRYIQGRHLPFWYMRPSSSEGESHVTLWAERAARQNHLTTASCYPKSHSKQIA